MALHTGFRTYHLAVQFHRVCTQVRCSAYLRDQLLRASSSVVLNLSEGAAKPVGRDRAKFYGIAFASLRECQAALDLLASPRADVAEAADRLAASLYRLLHPK